MQLSDMTVNISADITAFEAAADRVQARLAELRAEAEAIKKCQPGAKSEVDAVLDGIEQMARVERDEQ